MPVYVNRMLNLKKIKVVGFDMDYTLVRYEVETFERLAHRLAAQWLVSSKRYPEAVASLSLDLERAILGLVIDKRNGNLLKLNRYSKVKTAFHGLREIEYRKVNEQYKNMAIDLRSPEFIPLDTSFAISTGVLFSQLVELKSEGLELPDFNTLATDSVTAVDMVHRDGSLKTQVLADLPSFVIQDPYITKLLERYKEHNKKLVVITNSDFTYTKAILDHAINPHLTQHKDWTELFDIVITFADKPRFFERQGRFLKVDPSTGLMANHEGPIEKGIFQGGWFRKLQDDLACEGSEILYIGDHIYGDVVSIKKHCDWRTALVLGDLEAEIEGLKVALPLQHKLNELMDAKLGLEQKINQLELARHKEGTGSHKELNTLFDDIDSVNNEIANVLSAHKDHFNPFWGEVLRAGHEESRYADQMDKYACIYMTKVSDLYDYSPKTYFRAVRRVMPHEIELAKKYSQ